MPVITNHRTNGEIETIFNHHVTDAVGRIINHDLSDCSQADELARILGVFKYPGRVLGSTAEGDIVQLHPDLKKHFSYVSEHYRRIGLAHSRDIIWNDDFQIMKDFPDHQISVFFFGEKAHRARPDERWYKTTKFANSKNEFIRYCRLLGLPTPETFCYNGKREIADLDEYHYPLYLKLAVSASGQGVVKCKDSNVLAAELFKLDENAPFQLQAEVDAGAFINVQYEVIGDRLRRGVITRQILNGNEHAGNIYPTSYDPRKFTDVIAADMFRRGMKGVFAFDLAVTKGGEYLFIECNPRYNGATYPTKIAQKLGINRWAAKNFKTGRHSFADIDLGEVEYDRDRASGAIVLNWGCVDDGKLGVLLAGTPEEQHLLEERLLIILN